MSELLNESHYLSLVAVQIWIEYCSFALEKMADLGGMEFTRDIFERAITAVGLHSADVSSFFMNQVIV